ncbi:bifunctional riboflavin kinase/FAD synthetase [Marinospirillum insulare]|uniref:Riboflavin biosynthesis protein n=1 Tax=Marinospirillum insulare TaxID=217169 RepID=A0ABQ6A0E4_9GAMM|nr:bifunctional riboflavin kinase/FAD synthetase [Marinospirillum insulare]GLR65132.1 riboflavin biosynthesis protein [Marinospirillum insulare]
MELIRGIHNLRKEHQGCVATIGNFDGVHLGHQQILQQVREIAARLRQPATVMVFEPQPREFFAGDAAPPRINSFREKVERLTEYGAERIVCLQFNSRLRQLTAEEFVQKILVEGLSLTHLVVGDDFRFGCDRSGDFHLLQKLGSQKGFSVEHTQTFLMDNQRVSSTRVRQQLVKGNLSEAARLLGRPHKLSGRVVHGRQLGRTLGVPTANLLLGDRKPALNGVFSVLVKMPNGLMRPGIANIGLRPTVDGLVPALEVHLLGFDGNLYGQRLDVYPLAKLRDEKKFADLDALTTQINKDIDQCQQFFIQQNTPWQPGEYWLTSEPAQLLAQAPLIQAIL